MSTSKGNHGTNRKRKADSITPHLDQKNSLNGKSGIASNENNQTDTEVGPSSYSISSDLPPANSPKRRKLDEEQHILTENFTLKLSNHYKNSAISENGSTSIYVSDYSYPTHSIKTAAVEMKKDKTKAIQSSMDIKLFSKRRKESNLHSHFLNPITISQPSSTISRSYMFPIMGHKLCFNTTMKLCLADLAGDQTLWEDANLQYLPFLVTPSDPYATAFSIKELPSTSLSNFPFTVNQLFSNCRSIFDVPTTPPIPVQKKASIDSSILLKITLLQAEGKLRNKDLAPTPEPPRNKTHWDFVIKEAIWISEERRVYRNWKRQNARKFAQDAVNLHAKLKCLSVSSAPSPHTSPVLQSKVTQSRWAEFVKHLHDSIRTKHSLPTHLISESNHFQETDDHTNDMVTNEIPSDIRFRFNSSVEDFIKCLAAGDVQAAENHYHNNLTTFKDVSSELEQHKPAGLGMETSQFRNRLNSLSSVFNGKLREYQQLALDWMLKMKDLKMNAILAEEAGLGKRFTTIALLAHVTSADNHPCPHFIIAPNMKELSDWQMQIHRFCNQLSVVSFLGKDSSGNLDPLDKIGSCHVVLTTYETFVTELQSLKRIHWSYIILQHCEKEPCLPSCRLEVLQELTHFTSQHRLLLSSHPAQSSNLVESWMSLMFTCEQLFRNQAQVQFKKSPLNFIQSIAEGNPDYSLELSRRIESILDSLTLRRSRREVEAQIPVLTVYSVPSKFSKRQQQVYEDLITDNRAILKDNSDLLGLARIMVQLRSVCNNPCLLDMRSRPIGNSRHHHSKSKPRILTPSSKSLLPLNKANGLYIPKPVRVDNSVCLTPTFVDANANGHIPASCHSSSIQNGLNGEKEVDKTAGGGHSFCNIRAESQQSETRLQHFSSLHALNYRLGTPYSLIICKETKQLLLDDASFLLSQYERLKLSPSLFLDYSTSSNSFVISPEWLVSMKEMVLKSFDCIEDALKLPQQASIFECGKLQLLSNLLRQFKSQGQKCLIYTSMTKMMDILEAFINTEQYKYLRLDAGRPNTIHHLRKISEYFNFDDQIFVCIASTRFEGFRRKRMDILKATRIIFFDTDWNLSVESHISNYCHQMSQFHDVRVFRFISEGTIEEDCWNLIQSEMGKGQKFGITKEGEAITLESLNLNEQDFDIDHGFSGVQGGSLQYQPNPKSTVDAKLSSLLQHPSFYQHLTQAEDPSDATFGATSSISAEIDEDMEAATQVKSGHSDLTPVASFNLADGGNQRKNLLEEFGDEENRKGDDITVLMDSSERGNAITADQTEDFAFEQDGPNLVSAAFDVIRGISPYESGYAPISDLMLGEDELYLPPPAQLESMLLAYCGNLTSNHHNEESHGFSPEIAASVSKIPTDWPGSPSVVYWKDLTKAQLEHAESKLYLCSISEIPGFKDLVTLEKTYLIAGIASLPIYHTFLSARAYEGMDLHSTTANKSANSSSSSSLEDYINPLSCASWTAEEDLTIFENLRQFWIPSSSTRFPNQTFSNNTNGINTNSSFRTGFSGGNNSSSQSNEGCNTIPWTLIVESLSGVTPPHYSTRSSIQVLARFHDHLLPMIASARVRLCFDDDGTSKHCLTNDPRDTFVFGGDVENHILAKLPPSRLVFSDYTSLFPLSVDTINLHQGNQLDQIKRIDYIGNSSKNLLTTIEDTMEDMGITSYSELATGKNLLGKLGLDATFTHKSLVDSLAPLSSFVRPPVNAPFQSDKKHPILPQSHVLSNWDSAIAKVPSASQKALLGTFDIERGIDPIAVYTSATKSLQHTKSHPSTGVLFYPPDGKSQFIQQQQQIIYHQQIQLQPTSNERPFSPSSVQQHLPSSMASHQFHTPSTPTPVAAPISPLVATNAMSVSGPHLHPAASPTAASHGIPGQPMQLHHPVYGNSNPTTPYSTVSYGTMVQSPSGTATVPISPRAQVGSPAVDNSQDGRPNPMFHMARNTPPPHPASMAISTGPTSSILPHPAASSVNVPNAVPKSSPLAPVTTITPIRSMPGAVPSAQLQSASQHLPMRAPPISTNSQQLQQQVHSPYLNTSHNTGPISSHNGQSGISNPSMVRTQPKLPPGVYLPNHYQHSQQSQINVPSLAHQQRSPSPVKNPLKVAIGANSTTHMIPGMSNSSPQTPANQKSFPSHVNMASSSGHSQTGQFQTPPQQQQSQSINVSQQQHGFLGQSPHHAIPQIATPTFNPIIPSNQQSNPGYQLHISQQAPLTRNLHSSGSNPTHQQQPIVFNQSSMQDYPRYIDPSALSSSSNNAPSHQQYGQPQQQPQPLLCGSSHMTQSSSSTGNLHQSSGTNYLPSAPPHQTSYSSQAPHLFNQSSSSSNIRPPENGVFNQQHQKQQQQQSYIQSQQHPHHQQQHQHHHMSNLQSRSQSGPVGQGHGGPQAAHPTNRPTAQQIAQYLTQSDPSLLDAVNNAMSRGQSEPEKMALLKPIMTFHQSRQQPQLSNPPPQQ